MKYSRTGFYIPHLTFISRFCQLSRSHRRRLTRKIPVLQYSLAFQTWWSLIVGNVHIPQFGWVVVLSYAGNRDSHHHHDCNLTSHLGILSLLCWYHCDHLIIILIMTWSPYFLTLLMMSSGWWVWWWSAQMPEENEIFSQCVRCPTLCCPSDCQFQTADAPAAIAGGRTKIRPYS